LEEAVLMNRTNKVSLSPIILTYNEEKNIEECLKSVCGWVDEIFIVDSYSTDRTLEIAKNYTDKIYQNKFQSFHTQRNWALNNLPLSNEWILFLDADERISEALKEEIKEIISNDPADINGFYIKRRYIFMGRWIKHGGYYPSWVLRLIRRSTAKCEGIGANDYFAVVGKTANLQHDLLHEDKKGITSWIERHNKYATLEAIELLEIKHNREKHLSVYSTASQERRRWVKKNIWNNLPLSVRPFFYFIYRYFLRLGFLDGKEGFIYHFLHGFWFRFLIDVKYEEMRQQSLNSRSEHRNHE
jgi:glycosyltransferase involved in cell wall biosynthesis